MTYLKTFFLFFICLDLAPVSAQIVAPKFDCVRGDTLYWTPAINNCGPFVSYEIYFSTTLVGPYNLLASVADINATSFHHPAMAQAYYFLRANYDCPGQISMASDTLNNLPPATTTLEKVSVQSDGVLVSWYDNMDQKTVAYIIYRSTAQGTLPIDTVYGALQYLDLTASANSKAESYYVLAMDQCGNTGFFDMPHQTMHLTTEINFCEQYIELNWNNYGIWQNGTQNVQIWLGLDGAPLTFEHQVQLTDTLAYITGIDDGREYCIAMFSKEIGRDVTSFSNTVCEVSEVIKPVDRLEIRNVSVNQAGKIEVLWNHNADADISKLLVKHGSSATALTAFEDLSSSRPLNDEVLTTDMTINSAQEAAHYQVMTIDDCDTETNSSTMSSILLEVAATSPGQNRLIWSDLLAPSRQLLEFQLCRVILDDEAVIYQTVNGIRAFEDILTNPDGSTICYTIKAVHTNKTGLDTLIAFSNTVCIEPQTGLYVPNAFTPEGINSVFKPEEAIMGSISNYRMQIFNRWGGEVFQTNALADGWNGEQDGTPLNPGVYFYLISFDQPDGTFEQRSGTVNLIR